MLQIKDTNYSKMERFLKKESKICFKFSTVKSIL